MKKNQLFITYNYRFEAFWMYLDVLRYEMAITSFALPYNFDFVNYRGVKTFCKIIYKEKTHSKLRDIFFHIFYK